MNLYPQPQDEIVAEMVSTLDEGQREYFEERAGIRANDGHFPCGHAECLAMLEVLRRYPSLLTDIIALQIELDGSTEWLLTTDLPIARQHLANVCGKEVAVVNLTAVINEQYGGLACLSTLC
jgi:hypothetical protein